MRPYVDLFFMGAGFLLLETRNIVTFSLLFGTTWLVNALVFAGILVAVLAAIEVADRFRPRRPELWYVALLASLAVAWLVPASWLLSLPWAVRLAVAIVVAFLPVFFANVIFAQRFRDVSSSTTAFGANLLGAMLGGVLEYIAIVSGYASLLLVAAILYGLAFLFGRSKLVASGGGPGPRCWADARSGPQVAPARAGSERAACRSTLRVPTDLQTRSFVRPATCSKSLVAREHHELMSDAELGQEGVDRADLDAPHDDIALRTLSGSHVVEPVGHEQGQR